MLRQLLRRETAERALEKDRQVEIQPAADVQDDQTAEVLATVLDHQAELATSAEAIAGGDLARDIVVNSEDDTLGIAFRDMLAGLRRLVGQVKDAAADVDTGAQAAEDAIRSAGSSVDQLHDAIETIARGAEEQMAQVRAASGAIARVSESVDQVAASAQDLAEASERARLTAEQGAEAVRGTVHGIREIADSTVKAAGRVRELDALSQRIGAVVATIDAIAEQTNMLALNAAIEAARAGVHGRGFAVVAGEVRKLAERSQRETHQIGELVRNIQRETRETATQILNDAEAAQREKERADQTAMALAEIIGAVTESASQVDAIADSARTAAEGTHALGDMMQPVRLVAESNAEATHEMAAEVASAAEAMRSARGDTEALAGTAERLRDLISHFRLTEARRQAVNIPVSVRASVWTGFRHARIVDMSATGARIEGLETPEGIELQLSFNDSRGVAVHRRARVMRSALSEVGPWVGIAFTETHSAFARAA